MILFIFTLIVLRIRSIESSVVLDSYDLQDLNTLIRIDLVIHGHGKFEANNHVNLTEMENEICIMLLEELLESGFQESLLTTMECRLVQFTPGTHATIQLITIFPQYVLVESYLYNNKEDLAYLIKTRLSKVAPSMPYLKVTNVSFIKLGEVESVIRLRAPLNMTYFTEGKNVSVNLTMQMIRQFARLGCNQTMKQLKAGDQRLFPTLRGCWTFLKARSDDKVSVDQYISFSWKALYSRNLYSNKTQLSDLFKDSLTKGKSTVKDELFTIESFYVLFIMDYITVPVSGNLISGTSYLPWSDDYRLADTTTYRNAFMKSISQLIMQLIKGDENLGTSVMSMSVTRIEQKEHVRLSGLIEISQMKMIKFDIREENLVQRMTDAYEKGRIVIPDKAITDVTFGALASRISISTIWIPFVSTIYLGFISL